ncbi:MAG: helix-turn-helix domain-containing protein [Acidobacteria bacterium]|nr:helix-turn-helix domain-containing protein [Acidobacteriota bacterium]
MHPIGELLRGERLRQGLSLAQIAEKTRINLSYLEAIEAGETKDLPGAFFQRSFVRQYARALGMPERDLEPALSELRERAEAEQPSPPLQAPKPLDLPPLPTPASRRRFSGPRLSSIILLVAVIVGCSGIYALWQRARRIEPAPPVARQAVESPPAPKRQEPPPPPVAEQPAEAAAPQPAAATPPSPAVEVPKPVEAPPAAPAEGKLNIELSASEQVWYSATTDGKKITSVLNPGQTRRFAANERASFFFGNAGGVEIRVNGKSLGPIGPRGQLRTVVVTPEGFSIANPREKQEEPSPP